MKHLREGLIKQRGVVKINTYKEILNPKYEDICQEGNIVVLDYHGSATYEGLHIYIILPTFNNIKFNPCPLMVGRISRAISQFEYWPVNSFKRSFPYHTTRRAKILKVFETNIDPESIKTPEDLKRITEYFKKQVKL